MKYEDLKVADLRTLSKERGLTLESKGKRFTKPELIERIRDYNEEDWDSEDTPEETERKDCFRFFADEKPAQKIAEQKDKPENETSPEDISDEMRDAFKANERDAAIVSGKGEARTNKDGSPWVGSFAESLKQIKSKYGRRKKQEVYERNLIPGAFAVFIDVIETDSGLFIEKLRKAKVESADFETETVTLAMLYGDRVHLAFRDILYVTAESKNIPFDLTLYLRQQYERGKREKEEYEKRKRSR